MSNKMNNWSESRGRYEDSTHGVGNFSGDEDVSVQVVRRGVIVMCNCKHCGRQWKGIIEWSEVVQHFMEHPVPGTKKTRQGVLMAVSCNGCQKNSTMIVGWPEIRSWVESGVQTSCLDPRVLDAGPG